MTTSIRVAEVKELPPGKGKVVHVGERQVTIYNVGGQFHANASREKCTTRRSFTATDCSQHGLVFEVFAEDSPADVIAGEVCTVRVDDGAVWLELP